MVKGKDIKGWFHIIYFGGLWCSYYVYIVKYFCLRYGDIRQFSLKYQVFLGYVMNT